jgi:hypothetical protein
MKRKRELIVTNILALAVIASALIAGWREAALFGLAVLLVMDLIAILRERGARSAPRVEDEGRPAANQPSGEISPSEMAEEGAAQEGDVDQNGHMDPEDTAI